jgi:hypothetical protein
MSTLSIHQEPATIVHDFDGVEGHGDVITYHADVTGPDGLQGVLVGVQNSARQHGDAHWDRLGTATFRFEGDDSLSVCGVIRYEADELHSKPGMRHIRAVVGGTGQFIGARGEVVSVRAEDGTFTHTFTLL